MSKMIDVDSPFVRTVNKITDLLVLNIWTILCSLPIITAGASMAAAHYVALKLRRNEEGYTTREFFKAFKQNFKKATILWLIVLFVAIVLGLDFYIIRTMKLNIPKVIQFVIAVVAALGVCTLMWLFPLQAKFENTISKTIKNAFALSMIQAPKTILMVVLYVVPYIICFSFFQILPLFFFFGVSAPIYWSAMLYNKMFMRLEEKILENSEANGESSLAEETEEDGEKIFSDKSVFSGNEKK